jgi:hypothetical protein
MKNFHLIIVIAFFATFISCENVTKSTSFVTYLSKDSSYTFTYPQDWFATEKPNGVLLLQPLTDSMDVYQENILIQTEVLPMKIKDSIYYKSLRTQINIANPTVEITDLPDTNIQNKTYSRFQFYFSSSEGIPFKVMQAATMRDSTGYLFISTSVDVKDTMQEYNLYRLLEGFNFIK